MCSSSLKIPLKWLRPSEEIFLNPRTKFLSSSSRSHIEFVFPVIGKPIKKIVFWSPASIQITRLLRRQEFSCSKNKECLLDSNNLSSSTTLASPHWEIELTWMLANWSLIECNSSSDTLHLSLAQAMTQLFRCFIFETNWELAKVEGSCRYSYQLPWTKIWNSSNSAQVELYLKGDSGRFVGWPNSRRIG